jgi:hypothetical protein
MNYPLIYCAILLGLGVLAVFAVEVLCRTPRKNGPPNPRPMPRPRPLTHENPDAELNRLLDEILNEDDDDASHRPS